MCSRPRKSLLSLIPIVAVAAFIVGELVHDVRGQNITIPNTFTNGTVADAPQVNANFAALAANAFNRAAGIFSGDATPDADDTRSLGTNALRFANIRAHHFAGTSADFTGAFVGDGSLVTALNATQLTTGTVPNARLNTGQPMWTVVTTTSTGTLNDFAPGLSGHTFLRCNNASALTVNGFAAGLDGQRLVVVSIGAGQVDLAHQNAGSSAANRLVNIATSGNTKLAAGAGTAEYVYDTTTARWRLLNHDQGDWIGITPTYAGNGSMTVSSSGGDVAKYYLRGRALELAVVSGALTVGGTPSTQIQITNWPYSFAATQFLGVYRASDNAVNNTAIFQEQSASTILAFFSTLSAAANWTASTANSSLIAGGIALVQ